MDRVRISAIVDTPMRKAFLHLMVIMDWCIIWVPIHDYRSRPIIYHALVNGCAGNTSYPQQHERARLVNNMIEAGRDKLT